MENLATAKDELIKTDKNTITRYKVVEEKIDIGDLKIEKKGIEEELAKVVTNEEKIAWYDSNFPTPDTSKLEARLTEINTLLEIK